MKRLLPVLALLLCVPVAAQQTGTKQVKLSICLQELTDDQLAAASLLTTYKILTLATINQAPPDLKPEIYKLVRPTLQTILDTERALGIPTSLFAWPEPDPVVDCNKLATIRPMNRREERKAWEQILETLQQEIGQLKEHNAQLKQLLLSQLSQPRTLHAGTEPLLDKKQREFDEALRKWDEMKDRHLRDDLQRHLELANQVLLRDLLRP